METVYLEKPNSGFKMYALVSQMIIMIITLAVGGYLLGRYVIIKTTIAGGIMGIIGALIGIVYFIRELMRLDKNKK